VLGPRRLSSVERLEIEAGPIDTLPGGVRTTTVSDPDGNRIQLGEVPQPD
jgi:hypothetical protein